MIDGPFSLSLDEAGNLFVGETHNHLNLPKICSMDYYDGHLFVPGWSDDLIVLEKQEGGG